MKITYNLEPQERKTLVKAIAARTGLEPKYLGTPSYAYQLGELHLDKAACLTGPDDRELIADLRELHNFEPAGEEYDAPEADTFHLITPRGTFLIQKRFDTAAEAEAEGYGNYFHHEGREVYTKPTGQLHCLYFAVVGAPFTEEERIKGPSELEEEFPTEPELDRVVIEMPLEGFTPTAIDNLCKMVTAKEELIKLAIGADALPIELIEDRIAFPWLQTADPELVDALATFIAALYKTAREKKRVTAKPQEAGINDRYKFRCFMLSLGMIGSEYATARTRLLRDLSGNSGWLNGPPEKAPVAPEEALAEEAAE